MPAATNDGGYTLAEMLVVLLVFGVVMTLTTLTFNRIVTSSGHMMKSQQTQIEGMIGLELLRIDLENAGFGLPWSYQSIGWGGYGEAKSGTGAAQFNERYLANGAFGAPRGIVVGAGTGMNGSDYLVLKGAALGMNRTARKWSYLNYTSVDKGPLVKQSKSQDSELTLGSGSGGEWVIVLKDTVKGGTMGKMLVMNGADYQVRFNTHIDKAYLPQKPQDRYVVYGIDPDTSPARPFNRADYFLYRPDNLPARCASASRSKGTGRLYKMVLNQGEKTDPDTPEKYSGFTAYPLLDCVADFKVSLGLDSNGDGDVDTYIDDTVSEDLYDMYDAQRIREEVKEVRVFILAQDGNKDNAYLYPVPKEDRAIVVGDEHLARVWTSQELKENFGSDWRHYRWKLYRIVVQPKNLQ